MIRPDSVNRTSNRHVRTVRAARTRRARLARAAVLALALAALAGCGGNSGGASRSPDTPPPDGGGPIDDRQMPDAMQCSDQAPGRANCLSASEYAAERQRLARIARENEEFDPTVTTDGREFFDAWQLGAIRADQAYADVALALGESARPGAGVTIGFIDSGLDLESPEFNGLAHRTVVEQPLEGGAGFIQNRAGLDRGFSHGTAVASVAAGWRGDGHGMHGVAWGANVRLFALRLGRSSPDPGIISNAGLGALLEGQADFFRVILGSDVDIVNASIADPRFIDSIDEAELRRIAPRLIEVLEQRGVDDKTIVVWGAGNSGRDAVSVLAGLQARIPELRGHVLAVVATDRNGEIAHFSNRCGITADWCIAAPGVNILGAGLDGGLALLDGTSFAAPLVSGGLAVLKQLFRDQLSSEALVTRLFSTADKTGAYADRAVYGQGAMDLGAATSPVGRPMVAATDYVAGPGIAFEGTGMALGPALGDGFSNALAGQEIAVFDDLGAPFWYEIGGLVGAAGRPSLHTRYHELMSPWRDSHSANIMSVGNAPLTATSGTGTHAGRNGQLRFGQLDTGDPGQGGHAALADRAMAVGLYGDGLAAKAFTTDGLETLPPVSGATLSWRPGGGPIALRSGWLEEREGLLGSSTEGAFGHVSSQGGFAGVAAQFDAGGWVFWGVAEVGTSSPEPRGGIVTGLSRLTTTAFALDATRQIGDSATLSLSVSQPLRVEAGRAALSVPVGRTPDGRVLRQTVAAGLSPSGREIDVSARWRQRLETGGEIRVGAVWAHNPGHVAAAEPELALLAGWRLEF